jgi:hypothetical protein
MSETTSAATQLTSQYSTQVAGDLERNVKEQDRIRGEIEALQEQLTALQRDRTVLENIRQAIGVPAAPAESAPESEPAQETTASVPAPRRRRKATTRGAGKQTRADKSAPPARKRAGKKAAASSAPAASAQPTLVDLVREHLSGQKEPRSAAEVATELEARHPEREIKVKIVRLTLEGLVAKNQAQRSKQGRSVYYTAAENAAPASQNKQDKHEEPAEQPSA